MPPRKAAKKLMTVNIRGAPRKTITQKQAESSSESESNHSEKEKPESPTPPATSEDEESMKKSRGGKQNLSKKPCLRESRHSPRSHLRESRHSPRSHLRESRHSQRSHLRESRQSRKENETLVLFFRRNKKSTLQSGLGPIRCCMSGR